jgi:hypothetical protein
LLVYQSSGKRKYLRQSRRQNKQVEKKVYYSVWISKELIWEGLASSSFEAIDRACAKYAHFEPPLNRGKLYAKVKK